MRKLSLLFASLVLVFSGLAHAGIIYDNNVTSFDVGVFADPIRTYSAVDRGQLHTSAGRQHHYRCALVGLLR